MARYSPERKEAVLSKLLPPYNMTVAELARQEGISDADPLYLAQQSQITRTPRARSQSYIRAMVS